MMEIIQALAVAMVTGAVSSAFTVVAMRVDIRWMKSELQRHEKAIERAHERIDELKCKLAGA